MLALLLDEHISIQVARQIRRKREDIDILSVYEWRNGELAAEEDDILLLAARQEGKTLVTYDQLTIPFMLREWAVEGRSHSGVLFVDNKTIATSNLGGLVRSLIYYWDLYHSEDHTDSVNFLRPAS
jgi:hypothetical protein